MKLRLKKIFLNISLLPHKRNIYIYLYITIIIRIGYFWKAVFNKFQSQYHNTTVIFFIPFFYIYIFFVMKIRESTENVLTTYRYLSHIFRLITEYNKYSRCCVNVNKVLLKVIIMNVYMRIGRKCRRISCISLQLLYININ